MIPEVTLPFVRTPRFYMFGARHTSITLDICVIVYLTPSFSWNDDYDNNDVAKNQRHAQILCRIVLFCLVHGLQNLAPGSALRPVVSISFVLSPALCCEISGWSLWGRCSSSSSGFQCGRCRSHRWEVRQTKVDCDGAFFGCRGRVDMHRFSGLQYELRGASSAAAQERRELQRRYLHCSSFGVEHQHVTLL